MEKRERFTAKLLISLILIAVTALALVSCSTKKDDTVSETTYTYDGEEDYKISVTINAEDKVTGSVQLYNGFEKGDISFAGKASYDADKINVALESYEMKRYVMNVL